MTIRIKAIAAFAFAFLLLLAGGWWVTGAVLVRGFDELERASALRDLERGREVLRQELATMARTCEDWSDWDETWGFMGGRSDGFIERNLAGDTFTNLHLNVMLFLAADGSVRYRRWFDLAHSVEAVPPGGTEQRLLAAGALAAAARGERPLSGVVPLSGSPPLMIVFHPIHTSAKAGPARGGLLMGRFLDVGTVAALEKTSLLDLDLRAIDDDHLPPDFALARSALRAGTLPLLQPEGDDTLAAFAAVDDAVGGPSLLLRVRTPREIHRAGSAIRSYLLLALAGVGVVISLVALFLSQRLVLSRIYRLAAEVDGVARGKDIARRVDLPGRDELSGLAREINRMLDEMQEGGQALRRSEERLAVTLRGIADGVIAVDVEGKVVFLNQAAERLTGWGADEAVGRPLASVFTLRHRKSGAPVALAFEGLTGDRQAVSLPSDALLARRDGEELEVAGSLAPLTARSGELVGAVVVVRDMTEHLRFEQEILKAQKLESVALLAGGIAHSFNNTLAGVIGNLSLMRVFLKPEEKATRFLDEAEKAAQRAQAMAGQLITFARGGGPVIKRLDLASLAREAIERATQGTGAVAVFSLPPGLWPVAADEAQMGQVFHNLAKNSAQAMPGGGVITVAGENVSFDSFNAQALPAGRYAKITVEDEGEGIPAELLPRIFDPYFTTREMGGGLGLAVVYSILLRHHGRVAVSSPPGRGATFTLYLPAVPPPGADGAKEEEVQPVPQTGRRGAGAHILLMDADPPLLDMAGEMLAELGYRFALAGGGAEAIQRFRDALTAGDRFAAAVLDLDVPGEEGAVATARALHEMDAGVPLVLSSGSSEGAAISRPGEFGFSAVLAKPYNLVDLSTILARVLDGTGHSEEVPRT